MSFTVEHFHVKEVQLLDIVIFSVSTGGSDSSECLILLWFPVPSPLGSGACPALTCITVAAAATILGSNTILARSCSVQPLPSHIHLRFEPSSAHDLMHTDWGEIPPHHLNRDITHHPISYGK